VSHGDREGALFGLLDAIVGSRVEDWPCASTPRSDPAYDDGLQVLATLFLLRWEEAAALGTGLPEPDDDEARWMHRAVLAWAFAGDPGPRSSRALGPFEGDALPGVDTAVGRFAAYVAVEAAMAHARLDLAARLVDRFGDRLWDPFGHPYDLMVAACRARLLAFRGDVAGASRVLERVDATSAGSTATLLAGTRCLVHGNDADPAEVRRLAAVIEEAAAAPRDLTGAGSQMLAAFGLIAVGDVAEAVRRVLVAGGDPDLSALNVIDRALGLELLVALAVADEDLDAAEVWRDRALPLLASPIADSTVARLMSRVELLAGRAAEAVAWAERAVARAREAQRGIEAVEGEIVLSRARLALRGPGDRAKAVRTLERMVADAEAKGHRAARTAAARELRPFGQRLRPLSGSGWDGLTAREAEIARAVAAGASNRQVAASLNLAEDTVRSHLSRVLSAFGLATRAGLPGVVGVEPSEDERPGLTRRQRDVAELVARGHQNAAIAAELGISARTVERHVSDILARWNLGSRTAIARAVADRAFGRHVR
jgi:DNA-binding NarL/FixJ family response regulator